MARSSLHQVAALACLVPVLLWAGCVACDPVMDCGSHRGNFSKVTVSCNWAPQCILLRNSNVTIDILFTPSVDVAQVTAVVHGIIEGVPLPFHIPHPDACSSLQCPLKAGVAYNYSATFPIKNSYPRVTVEVKWEMKDEDGQDIICVLIPAHIQ